MSDDGEKAAKPKEDVVLLGPPTADGDGVHVLRARDQRLEAGELRALREGRPISGELVTLAPREGQPRVCDVKESVPVPSGTTASASDGAQKKGPAQVATEAYRSGWDEIFGPAPPSSRAPRSQLN
jgi:hypothetical protein